MTTAANFHALDPQEIPGETPSGPRRVIDLTLPATEAVEALKPVTQRPVLSVAEAAELLGVSEWLILQQVKRGGLPHRRCGRRIVFSRDRLLMWLNED